MEKMKDQAGLSPEERKVVEKTSTKKEQTSVDAADPASSFLANTSNFGRLDLKDVTYLMDMEGDGGLCFHEAFKTSKFCDDH